VCPDWRDPLNVGAAFRLADAAGVSGIILSGSSPHPPHPKIAKTARSTERVVRWEYHEDIVSQLVAARANGSEVIALEITDESISLFAFNWPAGSKPTQEQPLYLVAGNEVAGVSQEVLDVCSRAVALPLHGQNTSMNVSVALGAAVYLLLDRLQ